MHPLPVQMALTLARLRQQDVRDSFPRRPARAPDATAPPPTPGPATTAEPRAPQHRPATA